MMKGCFQVSYFLARGYIHNELDYNLNDTYIPKKLILCIKRFNNEEEFKKVYKHHIKEKTFPLYVITVNNKNVLREYESHTNFKIPKSEHEHMERYLAGTDDALYDYVNLLKYMPRIEGSEFLGVEKDFKKIKKDDEQG
jgi:hypothetical protein